MRIDGKREGRWLPLYVMARTKRTVAASSLAQVGWRQADKENEIISSPLDYVHCKGAVLVCFGTNKHSVDFCYTIEFFPDSPHTLRVLVIQA